jgi:predicted transcriptional regulator
MSRWQRFSGKEDVLKNGTRVSVLETVKANPGIHFRETCRKTGKEVGVVQYHLRALVEFGMVSSMRDGRYTRYYHVEPGMDGLAKTIIANMARPVGSELLARALSSDDVKGSSASISRSIGVTPQALAWHLRRMEADGLIDGDWKLKEGIALKYHEMERRGFIRSTTVDRRPS